MEAALQSSPYWKMTLLSEQQVCVAALFLPPPVLRHLQARTVEDEERERRTRSLARLVSVSRNGLGKLSHPLSPLAPPHFLTKVPRSVPPLGPYHLEVQHHLSLHRRHRLGHSALLRLRRLPDQLHQLCALHRRRPGLSLHPIFLVHRRRAEPKYALAALLSWMIFTKTIKVFRYFSAKSQATRGLVENYSILPRSTFFNSTFPWDLFCCCGHFHFPTKTNQTPRFTSFAPSNLYPGFARIMDDLSAIGNGRVP
ncbi:hypothetical protein B0H65DRAFT_174834 [Neurospora tetraspora]|uniref:Uncharacterized protein n=1 Tax=Neurospora tetraspora TaxID=94610 RepID=A0AAE0JID3_9PEZI|nr:hypothetical protein B0H65DRAFT_174834 [Neurospora tetraspora]